MKEFIEKLIGRLEEELANANFEKATKEVNGSFYEGLAYAYGYSVGIALQLAEEYKKELVNDDLISRKDVFRVIEKHQDIAKGDGGTLMSLSLLKSDIERISAPYQQKGE